MAKKLEEVFKNKMSRVPKDSPERAPKISGGQGGGGGALGRLQQVQEEADESDNASDWNKRLLQVRRRVKVQLTGSFCTQVQEQMRQLNQQIQMLVEESAARKRLRRQPGAGDRGPGPSRKKPSLVSPAGASTGDLIPDTPKGRGRGAPTLGGPPPSKKPRSSGDETQFATHFTFTTTHQPQVLEAEAREEARPRLWLVLVLGAPPVGYRSLVTRVTRRTPQYPCPTTRRDR